MNTITNKGEMMIDIKEFMQKQKIIVPKTGRNQPCPCGAKDSNGKPIKFKRCHWTSIFTNL